MSFSFQSKHMSPEIQTLRVVIIIVKLLPNKDIDNYSEKYYNEFKYNSIKKSSNFVYDKFIIYSSKLVTIMKILVTIFCSNEYLAD